MGQPLFLAENFFNVQQFPQHTVTSEETAAAGQEAFRVGVARRSVLNVMRNDDPTLSLKLRVVLDRIREADTLILDRNSDLVNHRLRLFVTSDDFLTVETPIDELALAPAIEGSASLNDPVHSIRTDEGVYMFKFDAVAGNAWQVEVDPLSSDSGFFGGVYLGKSFSPKHGGRLPFDDEDTWLDFGVVRRGVPDNDVRHGRTGAFGIMMSGEAEWNEARRTFRELFGKGHPMWIAPDSDRAERTWFGYNAPGSMGAAFSERPQGRTVVVRADEYDPRLP